MIDMICNSWKISMKFNNNIVHRYNLYKSGFMIDMKQIPGLLKQEQESFPILFLFI